MTRHRQPGWGERLLKNLAPDCDVEAMLGDLSEERALRRRTTGQASEAAWYWGQIVRSLPALLRASVSRRGSFTGGYRKPRRSTAMSLLLQDTKYAIRRLRRAPVFALFAIAILAVGIGLNVTVFSLVDAMLLRPPPFAEPDGIVHIYQDSDAGVPSSTAFPAYRDIAAMSEVFAAVAASRSGGVVNWETEAGPQPAAVDFATSSYFAVLGLSVARGAWFDAAHDDVGAESVAVVTDKAWRTRFASDPDLVGRSIRLNNRPVTIIGIGPRGFNGEAGAASVDFWLSISTVGIGGPFAVANLERRQDHWYTVKARLAPGVAVERARGELRALAARHGELFPDVDEGRDITLFRLDEVRIHPSVDRALTRTGIGLFLVAGVVLLLACANLANLLLARGIARAPELAVREALGCDRTRVGRPLLMEALLLSAFGGVLGLASASWLQAALPAMPSLSTMSNLAIDVRFDFRIVAFSLLAAIGTACLFGLMPSWRSSAQDVAGTLRDAGRGLSGSNSSWLRGTLVAGQIALSVALVAGTALLARSFANAERVDPGFDADRVAVIATNLFQGGVTPQEFGVVSAEILERMRALPGVENAAMTLQLPLALSSTTSTVVEGYEPVRGTGSVEMPFTAVSADYFATMGIPLVEGRAFTAVDRPGSPPVVVLNETAARIFLGGDAVGGRVRPQDDPDAWREVVGVVADTKVAQLQEPPTPLMYFSAEQMNAGASVVVVRASGDPAALLTTLPRALRDVRGSLPVTRLDTLQTFLEGTLDAARTSTLLMGAFAALALVLAGLGVYAAVSFSVGRRTQELGIRVALGATALQLVRMVVGSALKLALVGVTVGLLLAAVAARVLQAMLFGVAPLDLLSFGAAALLLIGAAAVAALVPALRAARSSASEALRNA